MKMSKIRAFLIALATALLALLGVSACTLEFDAEKMKVRAAEQQLVKPDNQALLVTNKVFV